MSSRIGFFQVRLVGTLGLLLLLTIPAGAGERCQPAPNCRCGPNCGQNCDSCCDQCHPLTSPCGCSTCPLCDEPLIAQPATPDVTIDDSIVNPTPSDVDLPPSQPTPSSPNLASAEQFAATGGSQFAVPNQIGDNFGAGSSSLSLRQVTSFTGLSALAGPGGLLFEVGGDPVPNDIRAINGTMGPPFVFQVVEPLPPTDAPTSPGTGFAFEGGTATSSDFISWDVTYSYGTGAIPIAIPDLAAGGGALVGRLKIAENGNPMPRDRVFFNYSLFDNVPLAVGGGSVNRFSPGFEKTFADGLASVEMRFPFAATLNTDLTLDGATDFSNLEFGDIFVSLKALLISGSNGAISAGLAMTVPTADDIRGFFGNREVIRLQSDSVHLMPYLGWLFQSGNLFTTGFWQLDVDANGNPLMIDTGTGLRRVAKLQDETYMYFDVALGYWIWQANPREQDDYWVTGIAPILELHYNRSLQDTDVGIADDFQVGQFREDTEVLNAVFGGYFRLGPGADITFGYTTPIGNGADQQFDGEFRAMANKYF